MAKEKSPWIVKPLELECVGMRHRASLSTRRFIKAYVAENAMQVKFKREPENMNDKNAIAIYGGGAKKDNPYYKMKLGYVPRLVAEVLAPQIDKGAAEFGVSLMTEVDEDKGIASIQAKLRVRKKFEDRA